MISPPPSYSDPLSLSSYQNAYTSFDETVYELHIAVDEEELVQKSFDILRQLSLEVRWQTIHI